MNHIHTFFNCLPVFVNDIDIKNCTVLLLCKLVSAEPVDNFMTYDITNGYAIVEETC